MNIYMDANILYHIKMHQAIDYYSRDEEMNLNVEHILINHLKKLGYYQFNYNE